MGTARNFRVEERRQERTLRLLLGAWFLLALGAGRVTGRALEEFVAPHHHQLRIEEPGWSPPFFEDRVHRFTIAFLAVAYVLARRARRDADRRILRAAGAAPLRDPRAENVAAEMAIAAGVPAPSLYVVEDPAPNAFSVGAGDGRGAIVCTRALVELEDRDALSAILAHEVAHLRHGDARRMTVLLGLTGALRLASGLALGPLRAFWEARHGTEDGPERAVRVVDGPFAPRRATAAPSTDPGPSLAESPPPPPVSFGAKAGLFAAVVLAAVALPFVAVAGSLAVVGLWWVVLSVFPPAAVLWAIVESFRDATPPRPASPPEDERGDEPPPRRAGPELFFLVPVGLVTGPAILGLGLLLPLVGAVGRALVARNRDLRADVAAVELTRHPEALVAALTLVRDRARSTSRLPRWLAPITFGPPRADEGGAETWARLTSGAPPMGERIRRAEEMTLLPGAPVAATTIG
ncbi:MAG: M48 family metalloprotease [Planctomycetota bacterium JB042]